MVSRTSESFWISFSIARTFAVIRTADCLANVNHSNVEELLRMITLRKITLENRRAIFNLEVADNLPAKRLYESFGFRDNGEVCDNEPVTVLKL